MSAYRTVVVGTDGSESSLKAVDRAASIAGDAGAQLVIACAYYPSDPKDVSAAADVLGNEAYQVTGSAPTYEILRTARERAHAAGAQNIVERAVVGAPVESLLALLDEVEGDLLVIGNRGLNTLTGRLLGSVPSDAARKATSDVLIVHTVR
ncbi:universal stress protein [Rhodococcus sp. SRB_17]|uniref:universal stress protein n=1 Tax=unclassified Rhodococcus (in: high G+C Gram-positive bacteria) TaxID=192944 RepID=UPI000B93A951|nr:MULTISPECIES: universal stress protein [unclassified Rhodococcus (in: high G+C Gram-positive bacteria)]MCJ0904232.1 universal stress protein [Rhodococcus sp. ARC_M6]MDI9915476.1 universal stress protein [Rhodococcus sp. IEGM 1379]NMM88699.1 universal stress protein [Rhodococcus sp. SRB_17]OYD70585.1 nucleotide-binding universal stress UspA family protein [Rhodococcus sp. OK302]